MYDIAIIGAGIAGSYLARELMRYKLNIILIDGESDVGNQISMANSAIVHAGYDAPSNTLKGRFNASGNLMYGKVCEDLDVPFRRCGSLVVARTEEEMLKLHELYQNGLRNGVPGMKILFEKEVHEMEPNLADDICGALYAPTAGIVSPYELVIKAAENAVDNGAQLILDTQVKEIRDNGTSFTLITNNNPIEAKIVINAAGIYADDVYEMVGEPYFELLPRKGQYFIFDKEVGSTVDKVIFPTPTKNGKGILVSPTVHGNLLIGPDAQISEKGNISTTKNELDYIKENAKKNVPIIGQIGNKIIRSYAGTRNTPIKTEFTTTDGDFIIEESPIKNFINFAGYESPGLSSIPSASLYAINEIIIPILNRENIPVEINEDFNPKNRKHIFFNELSEEEKIKLIQENPKYGKVICRCETVTEGEIIDVIHRSVGGRTVKGVKKRTRAGMGRCQGGFCSPRVVEIISRELNIPPNEVFYDKKDISYILTKETKEEANEN